MTPTSKDTGEAASPFKGPYSHHHGKIWMATEKCGDTFVLDVRAWGYLTGGGALNLDPDAAAKLQDEFGDRVANALNFYEASHPSQAPKVKP